jgi:hypothetical protein
METYLSATDLKDAAMETLQEPDNYCHYWRGGSSHRLKLKDYGIIIGNAPNWGDMWVIGECETHNYQATHLIRL